MLKIHGAFTFIKGNGIFLLQNDDTYLPYENFESNPPSTVNTAIFDCLDLSGPGCTYLCQVSYKSVVPNLNTSTKSASQVMGSGTHDFER